MATIFDVARLAGVSIKTVSRVMNNEPGVRPQTRADVLSAVEKLAYRPHSGARMMRSQRSGIIGMITGAISFSAKAPIEAGLSSIHIVRGVQQACRAAGKMLMIADTGGMLDEVVPLLDAFRAHRVEGVVYAANYHQQVAFPLPADLPLVLANCFDGYGTPAVIPDDGQGQSLAVTYLVERGHRRIGLVGLGLELIAGRLRRDAFEASAVAAGLREGDIRVAIGSRPNSPGHVFAPLEDALSDMLGGPARPTAICFGNDIMALNARAQIERMGFAVPGDISMVGYDDDVGLAESLRPRLTTVKLPYFEIGQVAAARLLDLMARQESPAPEPPQRVPSGIVERDSVRDITSGNLEE